MRGVNEWVLARIWWEWSWHTGVDGVEETHHPVHPGGRALGSGRGKKFGFCGDRFEAVDPVGDIVVLLGI